MRLFLIAFALVLSTTAFAQPATQNRGTAAVVTIDGPIGPAASHYVSGAFQRALDQHARVIILRLDTPGGLSQSMRDIIKTILASPVPVIGYVAPPGARAASAGTYILYAAHIAAMAPATNLGAATPVPVMGSEKAAASKLTAEQRKIINDAVAYIRSLANKRGRNADWAEKAVRKAASLPAEQALQKHVINLIAPSTEALLHSIDGKQVKVDGQSVVLHTRNLSIQTIAPNWRSELLSVLSNPTLVYLLFLAGIVGIFIEALHPGLIFPGVIGAICLLFALFAFHILPVNYVGIGLIVLGLGFMIAEAFVPSFGSLGIGGVIAFVVGSVLLMDTHAPGFQVKLSVIIGVAAAVGIGLALLIVFAIRAHRRKIVSGVEEMIGATAVPVAAFVKTGQVRAHGEIWRARTTGAVTEGQQLKVVDMKGLTLTVEPIEEGEQ